MCMKKSAAKWYFIKADEVLFTVPSVPLQRTEHAENIWKDDRLLLKAELKLLLRTDHSLTCKPCSARFWYATTQQTVHVISSVWSIFPTDRVQSPKLITDHFMRQDFFFNLHEKIILRHCHIWGMSHLVIWCDLGVAPRTDFSRPSSWQPVDCRETTEEGRLGAWFCWLVGSLV